MIEDLRAFRSYDSRGEETVTVEVITDHGSFRGSAPSGRSKGSYEVKNIPVEQSLKVFNELRRGFVGYEEDFEALDSLLVANAGEDFSKIGSHLGFALSSAFLKVCTSGQPYTYFKKHTFPYPLGNVIGGGAHGGSTDIQEFLLVPYRAKSVQDAVRTLIDACARTKAVLSIYGRFVGKNDEGAWAANVDDTKTLDIISKIADEFDCRLGIDVAATQLYKKGRYSWTKTGKEYDEDRAVDFIKELIATYDLYYVEDPFHEDSWDACAELTRRTQNVWIAGDDLFATNPTRLAHGIEKGACNTIVIKPNQIGTVGLALRVLQQAHDAGYATVVAHRSGETQDDVIADVAVGMNSEFIKCGVMGGERVAKLNRLLEIWERVEKPRMVKLRF